MTKIVVGASIIALIDDVWRAFNSPEDIVQWDASENWHTTWASNDLRVGGQLSLRIEPKSGGTGLNFVSTYTQIKPNRLIEFRMQDDRTVRLDFTTTDTGVTIRQTFEAESTLSEEQQRSEWQTVLDSFARHVESIAHP